MKRLRHILLMMLSLLMAGWSGVTATKAHAAPTRTFRCVVVTLTDGSVIEGCPDGQFFIDYQSGMVIFTDWERIDVYLEADRIVGWHYETITEEMLITGVESTTTGTTRFSLTDGALRISDANADAVIYDLQGKELTRVRKAAEIMVSFADIRPGTYVVKCGDASLKFMVK